VEPRLAAVLAADVVGYHIARVRTRAWLIISVTFFLVPT
jgi:hypothetical protein